MYLELSAYMCVLVRYIENECGRGLVLMPLYIFYEAEFEDIRDK